LAATLFEIKHNFTIDPASISEDDLIDGRFEIRKKLGQGGNSIVYRVWDRKMETNKIIKFLPEIVLNDAGAIDDLRRESRILIDLNSTGIARLYAFHELDSIKWFEIEYVGGETLFEFKLKNTDNRLPEDEVIKIGGKIWSILKCAHDQGIIHRNLKPQNIMLTTDGEIKVLDFGISDIIRTSMTRAGNILISENIVYMSPEQIRGRELDGKTDIYSLGVILYELLTGQPPFYQGDITFQILNEMPSWIRGVSDSFNDWLMRCLAKESENRPSTFYLTDEPSIDDEIDGFETYQEVTEKNEPSTAVTEILEPQEEVEEADTGDNEIPETNKLVPTIKKKVGTKNIPKRKTVIVFLLILSLMLGGYFFYYMRIWKRHPEIVYVKGGTFQMGSRAGLKNEKPVHKVTVNSYWIGKYEVTVAEFSKFVGETGYMTDAEKNGYASVYIEGKWVKKVGVDWRCNEEGKKRHMNTNKYPVIFVSWNDANAYCRWLSQKTGYNYRLPTEVEWEYADRDRGLNNRRWSGTNNANKVKEYAWSKANSKGKVHPIGKRKPNDLQLYDMSGNVWEWCADWCS